MLQSLMPILLIAIVGIAIFSWYKKKKSDQKTNPSLSMRKNKDEVWQVIKQFLKDNGEQGKTIADSYVCKRDHVDMVNPSGSYMYKKNKNAEVKIRKWLLNQRNKQAKAVGKQQIKPPKARDLFVVVFETKDAKTGVGDLPRCFECEVVQDKIPGKKEYSRKVVITKRLNYDQEMEWIAPVMIAEAQKNAAIEKRIAKQKVAERKRELKRREKAQKRAQKHADKE